MDSWVVRVFVTTEPRRLRLPWRLLVLAVGVLAAWLAAAVVAVAVAGVIDLTVVGGEAAVLLVWLTASGLAVSVVVLATVHVVDRRRPAAIGLAVDGRFWREVAGGGLLGVGLVATGYGVGVAAGVYDVVGLAGADPASRRPVWLGVLVVATLSVGLYEELLLRGYLLTNLAAAATVVFEARTALAAATGVSTLVFAALHASHPAITPVGGLTLLAAGLMLALGYLYTGRLGVPIGLHATWNLTVALLGLPVSGIDLGVALVATDQAGPPILHGGGYGFEGGLIGTATAVGGCLAVVAWAHLTGRRVRLGIASPDRPEEDPRRDRPAYPPR